MRPVDLPESAPEKWDRLAEEVKAANGSWWVVVKDARKGGRNEKVRENLERRGLVVEVRSRNGDGSPERPWRGWWIFARTI